MDVPYVINMPVLIWTAGLRFCVAAVTLSHAWRAARLLAANLCDTNSTQCFLNRIVTVLVQGSS